MLSIVPNRLLMLNVAVWTSEVKVAVSPSGRSESSIPITEYPFTLKVIGEIASAWQTVSFVAVEVLVKTGSSGIRTVKFLIPLEQLFVSAEIQDGMDEFNSANNIKTIDEIFKETIEDTIDEIESYDPDIFSGT